MLVTACCITNYQLFFSYLFKSTVLFNFPFFFSGIFYIKQSLFLIALECFENLIERESNDFPEPSMRLSSYVSYRVYLHSRNLEPFFTIGTLIIATG